MNRFNKYFRCRVCGEKFRTRTETVWREAVCRWCEPSTSGTPKPAPQVSNTSEIRRPDFEEHPSKMQPRTEPTAPDGSVVVRVPIMGEMVEAGRKNFKNESAFHAALQHEIDQIQSAERLYPTSYGVQPPRACAVLQWRRCPESWLHQLIYTQAEVDGLLGLGYGRLSFLHQNQRNRGRLGRWQEGGFEFDLLMRSPEGLVCIELKRRADRGAIAQCLDYMAYLKQNMKIRGDVRMALITAELEDEFLRTMREAWTNGLKIDLFVVDVVGGNIELRKVDDL